MKKIWKAKQRERNDTRPRVVSRIGWLLLTLLLLTICLPFGLSPVVWGPELWGLLFKPYFQVSETARDLLIDSGHRYVYWLDDSTLVFAAAAGKRLPLIDDRDGHVVIPSPYFDEPVGQQHIYIWKLGSKPKVYQPQKWLFPGTFIGKNYLCARSGSIYYSVEPLNYTSAGRWSVSAMAGAPGTEARTVISRGSDDQTVMPWNLSRFGDDSIVNKRCDDYVDKTMEGHAWFVSRHADTILDFGTIPPSEIRPDPLGNVLRLVHKNGHATPLPSVKPEWVSISCVQSLSWEDSFVVWRCDTGDARLYPIQSYPVWKVRTDGTVARSVLKTGNLWGVELIPSRAGYFATVETTKDAHGWGLRPEAGLYAVEADGKMRQLLQGDYRIMAVSPNGCLGAFTKEGGAYHRHAHHLAVLDFCKVRRG